jgi:hypothetical protein
MLTPSSRLFLVKIRKEISFEFLFIAQLFLSLHHYVFLYTTNWKTISHLRPSIYKIYEYHKTIYDQTLLLPMMNTFVSDQLETNTVLLTSIYQI